MGCVLMSNDVIKAIDIKNNQVFFTCDGDNRLPYNLQISWECVHLSNILSQKGKEALYSEIGKEVWEEELFLEQGNFLCNFFIQARNVFPSGMNFMSFDSLTAGRFLGEMVSKLEEDSHADLSGFVDQALLLMNDRDHILESAKRTGWNFLNYASQDLQQDRDFSLKVLNTAGGVEWFEYPKVFSEDKDFALQALKVSGCFYRELGENLRADKEVIFAAFQKEAGRDFHEFLASMIPERVFYIEDSNGPFSKLDKSFIFNLIDACPSIHLSCVPKLLEDKDIVMKWVQVGTFFPHRVTDLPKKHLEDKDIQNALIHRFKNTDDYEYLVQNMAIRGVSIPPDSLDAKIKSASTRVTNSHTIDKVAVNEASPER